MTEKDLQLPPPAEDPEFEELSKRFEALKDPRKRRETLFRLSKMFDPESEEHKTGTVESGANAISSPAPVQQVANTNVTVESSADRKLPRFSGSAKLGQGEVTYRKWKRDVDRLMKDTSSNEAQKKRAILKSLTGSADDIADINSSMPLGELLKLFHSTYGKMVDGDDLLIEFGNIVQDEKGQTASEYLSHLYVQLGEVVLYGGITIDEMDKKLLKQYLRGSRDQDINDKLRLDDKLSNPPTFAQLIQDIRSEESKRTARRLLLKKNARVQAVAAKPDSEEVEKLQQRVQQLEALAAGQAATLDCDPLQEDESHQQSDMAQLNQRLARVENQLKSQVRKSDIFCYRCGQDLHVATDCNNAPNKILVQQKVDARRSKHQAKNSAKLAHTGSVANKQ